MPIGHDTNTSALASSSTNASASSSKVTLELKDDKRLLRKPSRGKLLPWSRRGRKSASAEHIQDGPEGDMGSQDNQVYAGRSASTSPGGSEEAFDTNHDNLIPTPWPCEDRLENCPSITSVPPYKHSTFYRLHSPAGPPYYLNHHLRPPNLSALTAARSPASAFSSSFPPLAAIPQGSPPLRTIRLGLYPPPDQQYSSFQATQSPSESVLPTPSSSTSNGFAGASNVPSRDEHVITGNIPGVADVDQLDLPNLWGQRYHHDSPYDLGQRKGKKPIRPIGGSAPPSATDLRSRVPSHSRFSRPTTPSPLSQSTPAVNVHPESENGFPPVRRKLSKRKPSGLQAPSTMSPSPENDSSSDSHHFTPSPIDRGVPESSVSMTSIGTPQDIFPREPNYNLHSDLSRKLSKRKPVQFPPLSGYIASPEKNKGGGVFGRMAKRFSFGMGNFMSGGRRGMVFERRHGHKGSMSLTDVSALTKGPLVAPQNDRPLMTPNEPPQQELKKQGPKRVPPPSLEESISFGSAPASQVTVEPSILKSDPDTTPGPSTAPQLPTIVSNSSFGPLSSFQQGAVRNSVVSTDTEPSWSLGKLTIANPDMAGGSDTDTSLRGKGKGLSLPSQPRNRFSLVDPDPRASIRVEVNSHSSVHTLDVSTPRTLTLDSPTPVQAPVSLRQEEAERLVPPPPPKERSSVTPSETTTGEDVRVSVTESSVTATSRPSSRVSSPDLPPTPKDLPNASITPPDTLPPQVPSKAIENVQSTITVQPSQNGPPDGRLDTDISNLPSVETPSPAKARPTGRQEHVYIVDVPVEGSLFVRSSSDGVSIPPVEKPELPPLPPKSKPTPENPSNSDPPSTSRQSKERKESTIFTSLFTPPRPRRTSETSPNGGSTYEHGSQTSITPKRTRISPDKSTSAATAHTRVRTNSGSPETESRRERARDRDYRGSRRGDRRSYIERRGDSEGDKRREFRPDPGRPPEKEADKNGSRSQEAERDLQRERGRRQAQREERQDKGKVQRYDHHHEQTLSKEEEEQTARKRHEREEEERRAKRAKEREEEERRERKAREKEEEQRRLKRVKEKEEEERKLRRAKEKDEEERRAREDEERRARRIKEREEEERRVRRERERVEEEKRARREREEQERKIRRAKEEEEKRKAREEERRLAEEKERARKEKLRIEEERRLKEEEERRLREEEKRAREEERRARREEEERRAKEEERRARKEQEKEELARAARKESERLEAARKAQEETERKERERKERKAREEQQRREKERERELIRQREMEVEQNHQVESSWSRATTRSFHSISVDRPTTSIVGSSYSSEYSHMGYNWEPSEKVHAKKRSYDIHESGKHVKNRKEPAKLPDYNRRVELGIYPPESSSHYRRPRAVSLESAPSQPPTPPYKEKEYSLRRRQINGHLHPSMTVDDVTFTRSRPPPRPVSGFPSPDVFKASEAWEHDRFWRGSSMNFDTNSAVSGSLPPASWTDTHSYAYETPVPSTSYYSPAPPGSSYTSFMVQPPSWSYPHYQPAAPIEPFTIPSSSNPLPPPPRQLSYHQPSSS